MRLGISVHRCQVIIASLGILLALSGTVEAGITLSGGTYQGIGDPQSSYEFLASLDPGSTLSPGSLWPSITLPSYFTLDQLIGIKGIADVTITTPDPANQSWFPIFGIPSKQELTVDGQTSWVFATSVTFFYTGNSITNTSSSALPLGEFLIYEDDYSIPALPAGLQLPVTYSSQTLGSPPETSSLTFTVVPEPSSLVVVALVGASSMGVGLLRRWRRVV